MNSNLCSTAKAFNDVIDDIGEKYGGKLWWECSVVACRNTILSNALNNISLLLAIDRLWIENEKITEIICHDREIARILKRRAKVLKKRTSIKISWKHVFKSTIQNRVSRLKTFIILMRRLRARGFGKKPWRTFQDENYTIIDTFVVKGRNNIFGSSNDRYYKDMNNYIPETTWKRILFLPQYVGYREFNEIFEQLRNDENALLLDDCLISSDYFSCYQVARKIKSIRMMNCNIENLDVGQLIKSEFLKSRFSAATLNGILGYTAIKRLAKTNIKIGAGIDWFENQPIDRGYVMGMRTYFPEASIHGYQAVLCDPYYQSFLRPTKSEQTRGVVPDAIYVPGKNSIPWFETSGKSDQVALGPAFRFALEDLKLNQQKNSTLIKTILIGFPISFDECDDILRKLFVGVEDDDSFNWIIKPHPSHSIQRIEQFIQIYNLHQVTISTTSFEDAIANCDLLVTTGSSVSIETLARNKPVIIMASGSGISQNPCNLLHSNEGWRLCYNGIEVRTSIAELEDEVNSANNEEIPTMQEARNYFGIVNEKLVNEMVVN